MWPPLLIQPDVVVTRHVGLIEAARACGLHDGVPVIPHATEDDVRGRVILGVLPLRLAVEAAAVIEADLEVRLEDRGRELTGEETLARLKGWKVYTTFPADTVRGAARALRDIPHQGDMVLLDNGVRAIVEKAGVID